MKRFVKITFVAGLCLRMVLFVTPALAAKDLSKCCQETDRYLYALRAYDEAAGPFQDAYIWQLHEAEVRVRRKCNNVSPGTQDFEDLLLSCSPEDCERYLDRVRRNACELSKRYGKHIDFDYHSGTYSGPGPYSGQGTSWTYDDIESALHERETSRDVSTQSADAKLVGPVGGLVVDPCCIAIETYESIDCSGISNRLARAICDIPRHNAKKEVVLECGGVEPNSTDEVYEDLRDYCEDSNDSCKIDPLCVRDKTQQNIIRNSGI